MISFTYRSSRPEMYCKKGVLRNFAKFTGKHLCQSLFFDKVADLRPATLLKKRPWHRCFPVNFAKFLRTPFLTEHLRWLLLHLVPHQVNGVPWNMRKNIFFHLLNVHNIISLSCHKPQCY